MNPEPRTAAQLLVLPLFIAMLLILGALLRDVVVFSTYAEDITNPLPPLNLHAWTKHSWRAVCVHEWCQRLENPDKYHWDCGKVEKYIFPMEPGTWGIYVKAAGAWRSITGYPCYDAGYIRDTLKGCKNEYMSVDELVGQ